MFQDRSIPILIIGAVIILVGVLGFVAYTSGGNQENTGKYDTFAQCLKDKGAKFYGAFWCPHCRDQKALFGLSVDKLPYVECATPDGKSQTQICTNNNITGYPTWIFADGSRVSGVQTLEALSQKTSCPLP